MSTEAILTRPDVWTSERIHDELVRRILDREIGHGDVLLETALSAEFGVSRTPVREAIQRILDAHLLERGSRGFRLTRWSPNEMLDLYQARIALESEAAALAAERHLPLDLARLEHLAETAAASGDDAEVLRINGQWHRELRNACHNSAIQELLTTVSLQLRVAEGNDLHATDPPRNDDDHREIIEALRTRNPDVARESMRSHLTRVRNLRTQQIARRG